MINCRSVVKTKLPIAAAVKIGLRGNWVLRILTIILLSVAFAALTMITTFYTGNYKSAYISSIENSLYYHTGFRFSKGNELFDKSQAEKGCMGQEIIDFIEAKTPERKYVYQLRLQRITYLYPYTSDYDVNNLVIFNDSFRYVYAEDEAAYEQLGFEVMAGRYPQTPYEIAISDYQYELFKEHGYRDGSAGFYYSYSSKGDYRYSNFNGTLVESEKEEIDSPEDLIGKPIVMYGDVENGVLNENQDGIWDTHYFGKIVGVIDTHYDEVYDYYHKKFIDLGFEDVYGVSAEIEEAAAKVFLAKELVEVYSPGGDYLSDIMYTTKAKDRGEAKELVELDYAVSDYIRALVEEKRAAGETVDISEKSIENAGLREHSEFARLWQNDSDILVILVPAALLFGVFAVVLIVHLARATLNEKQRQIGVLRALGCGQDSIRRVVWSEQLFIAGAALAVTLISTYTLFCLWWERYFTYISTGVPRAFFNGWNVLIIGALMIGMPLLATAGPLRKAGRRTIASQLSDPTERNRTGRQSRKAKNK